MRKNLSFSKDLYLQVKRVQEKLAASVGKKPTLTKVISLSLSLLEEKLDKNRKQLSKKENNHK